MAVKRYTDLDPRKELEQTVAKDLHRCLEKRGGTIKHHGTAAGIAPALSPADITVDWKTGKKASRLLVEVAQRTDESEFTSIVQHLDNAVLAQPKTAINVLYAGRSTSVRMARFIRNENRRRESLNLNGRLIFCPLNHLQEFIKHWATFPATVYPIDGVTGAINRWAEFTSDLAALTVLQEELFPDWDEKAKEIDAERQRALAVRQERLRKDIVKLENKLRERGITGQRAHKFLIFLFFCALYEDKRGPHSRISLEGFKAYKAGIPSADKSHPEFREKTVHHLLSKEIREDPEIRGSSMMDHYEPLDLTDDFIAAEVLPIFESYPLSEGGIDFIGAVFEALARRAEKDNRIGQFFTPETAVIATCRLAKPDCSDIVLDPACGTARFLIHAMSSMLRKASLITGPSRQRTIDNIKQHQLLGTDIDPWVATIAKMNMYLHGDGKSNVKAANGLALSAYDVFSPRVPSKAHNAVDIVLTNPPLGDVNFREVSIELARNGYLGAIREPSGSQAYTREIESKANTWSQQRLSVVPHSCIEEAQQSAHQKKVAEWQQKVADARVAGDSKAEVRSSRYLADAQAKLLDVSRRIGAGDLSFEPSGSTAKGGALFLSAILDYLKSDRDPSAPEEWRGGIVGLIIDEAVLNTAGYGLARKFIYRNYFIKAVISLPRNAFEFLAKTTAKTSILLLTKKPDSDVVQREPVFFAKAETIGYTSTGVAPENDLVGINESFDVWREQVQQCYKNGVLDRAKVKNVAADLPLFGEKTFLYALDPSAETERLDFAYRRMRDLSSTIKSPVRLGDIVEHVIRIPDDREVYAYAYVSSGDGRVRSKGDQDFLYKPSELRELRTGDILLSGIDAVRGAIGVVGRDCSGLVVSKEFFTLRIQPKYKSEIAPEYIACILRSPLIQAIIEGTITGVSNRTRIESVDEFLQIRIPKPASYTKQKTIVNKLRMAFRAQDKVQKSLEEIEDEVTSI